MKCFDFVIIGGGISGLLTAYELREFKTLLIDKKGVLEGASGAAGAFLFPKVGYATKYTKFINDGIIKAVEFYKNVGINTNTKGVLILPRDERDIEKFKKYESEITLPFEKRNNGFFFEIGSVINPEEVRKKLKVKNEKIEVVSLEKRQNWVINEEIEAKNVILATGYEKIIDIPYIKIRPVWGERIEILSEKLKVKNEILRGSQSFWSEHYYHKNCSVGLVDRVLKIGATHKRDCLECRENLEEANELIQKANEIIKIEKFEISNIKGGFRAASVDYFPVLGKIIDTKTMLLEDKHIVKGDLPKEYKYIEGLYIINGMGGRGFSNAVVCAKALKKHIFYNEDLGILDNRRLFIKWARKNGEKYLKEMNVKS
ncbi:NAD(P)/FAD-dependent oxidoreductase [Caminibacter sp.]